ncbi:hypothetical protein Tco_1051752 [Tanacetum coccineum]
MVTPQDQHIEKDTVEKEMNRTSAKRAMFISLSLAENVIVVGADNRSPMLDKTQYSSWASRMLLYIKGKENRKLLVDSVLNGPFKYGIVTVPDTQTTPATIRDKTYDELTDTEKILESCDIKATNIVL